MLQIIQHEFFKCKICNKNYSESNYPVSLNCGETLCNNCKEEMINKNKACPFNDSHQHTSETTTKNIILSRIMSDVVDLIKVNKQNKKYDQELEKLIKELKERNKKNKSLNGDIIFRGVLKDNKPIGRGQLIHKNIGIFNGKFYGEYHKGKGQINYNDNNLYTGEWENFKRQKFGILEFANHDKYIGEFKDDLFDGLGQLFINDLNVYYKGNWIKGKKEGEFKIYNEKKEFIRKESYENNIKKE